MNKLKRKKQDDVDAATTCICNQSSGKSTLIKCGNEHCCSPWWHCECAGLTNITTVAAKKISWVCPTCIVNQFSDKFAIIGDSDSLDSEQLRGEIKHGTLYLSVYPI